MLTFITWLILDLDHVGRFARVAQANSVFGSDSELTLFALFDLFEGDAGLFGSNFKQLFPLTVRCLLLDNKSGQLGAAVIQGLTPRQRHRVLGYVLHFQVIDRR